MVKVEPLIFKTFEDENTPVFTCTMCANKGGKGFLYTDIEFAKGAHFTIVLCSTKCEKSFKTTKGADEYVTAQVRKMAKIHRKDALKKSGMKKR